MKKAFVLAFAAFAAVHTALAAEERLLTYTPDMLIDLKGPYSTAKDVIAADLQDNKFNHNRDYMESFTVDFGYEYRITKIVYAGRADRSCNHRMQGCEFKSSSDNAEFVSFCKVPGDYLIDIENPCFTEVIFADAEVKGRYFRIGKIQNGSLSELRFYTDSDVVKVKLLSFADESAESAKMRFSVALDGDFAEDAGISVVAYLSEEDYGDNADDWMSKAVKVELGTVANGAVNVKTVPSVTAGRWNYLRLAAEARNADGETCRGMLDFTGSFFAAEFSEVRARGDIEEAGLKHYPGSGEGCKAFDGDDATSADGAYTGGVDLGAVVRVDKIDIVSSGESDREIPLQMSMDGWTWSPLARRGAGGKTVETVYMTDSKVLRYVRFGGDGSTVTSHGIKEVRFYRIKDSRFVKIENPVAEHTSKGIVFSGTLSGENLQDGEISLAAYAAERDYGMDAAAWQAAGERIEIGKFVSGDVFKTAPIAGTSTEKLRYAVLVAEAEGAAACISASHPFTLNDEYPLEISTDMIAGGIADVAGTFTESDERGKKQIWKQTFFGAKNVVHVDDHLNGIATFGTGRVRITMVEWHSRLDDRCHHRAREGKFWIYTRPGDYQTRELIAEAASAVGADDSSYYLNRWNAVAPDGVFKGNSVGVYTDSGNGFFRFWGYRIPDGFTLTVR